MKILTNLVRNYRKTTLVVVLAFVIVLSALVMLFIVNDNENENAVQEEVSMPNKTETTNSDNNGTEIVAENREVYPAEILNLTNWKLTLPINTEHEGEPDEIEQPELTSFINKKYFYPGVENESVIFRAHAGGATTKNSNYPRSELREMTSSGVDEASWRSDEGSHELEVRQSINHLPDNKPSVVSAQVHDGSDDVILIKIDKQRLFVEADSDEIGVLDESYNLGDIFTLSITVKNNVFTVSYNGDEKVTYNKKTDGLYFKAGCYTQSNTNRGDNVNAYGEVEIFSIKTLHH